MTPEQTRKLERIARYSTRYEIAASKGEERFLVLYTARKSKAGLIDACRKHGQALLDSLKTTATEISFVGPIAAIDEWTVKFTGRTQREAILAGELPFILDRDLA